MLVAWLIGCFHPWAAYPPISNGGYGSAKSTRARVLRNLADAAHKVARGPKPVLCAIVLTWLYVVTLIADFAFRVRRGKDGFAGFECARSFDPRNKRAQIPAFDMHDRIGAKTLDMPHRTGPFPFGL